MRGTLQKSLEANEVQCEVPRPSRKYFEFPVIAWRGPTAVNVTLRARKPVDIHKPPSYIQALVH